MEAPGSSRRGAPGGWSTWLGKAGRGNTYALAGFFFFLFFRTPFRKVYEKHRLLLRSDQTNETPSTEASESFPAAWTRRVQGSQIDDDTLSPSQGGAKPERGEAWVLAWGLIRYTPDLHTMSCHGHDPSTMELLGCPFPPGPVRWIAVTNMVGRIDGKESLQTRSDTSEDRSSLPLFQIDEDHTIVVWVCDQRHGVSVRETDLMITMHPSVRPSVLCRGSDGRII